MSRSEPITGANGRPLASRRTVLSTRAMRTKHFFLLSTIAAVLIAAFALQAAKPADFSSAKLGEIWTFYWSGDPKTMPEPKVEKLSEREVIERMTGRWIVMFGFVPDRLTVSLSTNRLVEVSGQKDGKEWKKTGEWRVVSDKIVVFLEEDSMPGFIFRTRQRDYIFDPWAKPMMSELKRENRPAVSSKAGAPDQQLQLQSVHPVNGKISKTNILNILNSMDTNILNILNSIERGLVNQDAGAVVASFASNAVITATIVEDQRTETLKRDTGRYRSSLESASKSFSDYERARKDVTIEITPNGQTATSSSTLIETFRLHGNMKQAVIKESNTFEVIEGKVLLIKMNSEVAIKDFQQP